MSPHLEKSLPDSDVNGSRRPGGSLALASVLTFPRRLGAAVCLSGWLQLQDRLPGSAADGHDL